MSGDLAAFLLARISDDEWWAHEASRRDATYVDTGVHWQWVHGDDDTPADMDPARDPYMGGNTDHGYMVSLRSVEEFPTASVGPLPQFALGYAEEVPVTVAGHIARWDPARVLAECEAKRRIVVWYQYLTDEVVAERPNLEPRQNELLHVLTALAAPYAGHPDFDPAWRL